MEMDEVAEQVIGPKLDEGECWLWAGRPRRGLQLLDRFGFSILVPLFIMGALFYCGIDLVLRGAAAPCVVLMAIPFAIPFSRWIVDVFFLDARRRGKTFYALTDRRVMIIFKGSPPMDEALLLTALGVCSLTEKNDGSGTILLGTVVTSLGRRSPLYTLEMIEDARNVYNQILTAGMQLDG